jgi:D-aminoacyl-tRNA deacylase
LDNKIVPTNAKVLSNYLRKLNDLNIEKKLGFEVVFEATHHGPYLEKPSIFIEVGSDEKQWNNLKACEAVAQTIAESTLKTNKDYVAIGFGSGHYSIELSKLILRKNFSLGHIAPLYALENLSQDLVQQMVKGSNPELIVLDWKWLKQYKQKVLSFCEQTGLKIERVEKLLKQP